jgi:hypothetical protein
MTIIFIENLFGSGQVIKVLEQFGEAVVEHTLAPGDNARIAVSAFKSITVSQAGDGARPQRRRAVRPERCCA